MFLEEGEATAALTAQEAQEILEEARKTAKALLKDLERWEVGR